MSDSGASLLRLASTDEDPSNHHILISLSSPSFSSLTVCAPAPLLVRVPYFATQLAEPWIASHPQQQIALECTPASSPQDYLQCLRFLTSSPTSWPPRQASVSEVLQILPVADHLLFQDCWDTCMAVLASSPWSICEEDAIRATLSNLNMEPSPDMRERLDTSHDGAALKTLFRKMLSSTDLEDDFRIWCQTCLNHSSAPFAAAFHSILLKVMESLSASPNISLPREWYVLAKIFLQFTDAQQFILYLVNSEGLLEAVAEDVLLKSRQQDVCHIYEQVLEKVEKRLVLVSNSQRARLLERLIILERNSELRLAETLPFGDTARMNAVRSGDKIMTRWISHVSHRVSQMDEANLKAVCENFENYK